MAKGLHAGITEKLFRNTGNYGTPTWTEVPIVTDVSLPFDKSKAEIKARISTWKMTLTGIKSAPLEFGIIGDTNDANYGAFRDAFLNDTLLDLAIADQAIASSGCEYFRADYYVYGFAVDQKLEEAQTAKVSCDLAYSNHVPAFTNVP